MEQDNIIEKITNRFNVVKRLDTKGQRIVFWIDELGEFKDSIDDYDFGDIKLLKLNEYDSFKVKYILEHEDSESRYLIYVPFHVQDDEKNILADMMHYCEPHFCADKTSLLCMDLGIDLKHTDLLKKYSKFFNSADRIRKLKRLETNLNDAESILSGMMAVIIDSDSPDFNQILKDILQSFADSIGDDNAPQVFEKLEIYDLTDAFWDSCGNDYGVKDTTLGGLARTLFVSYASCKVQLKSMSKIDSQISSESACISTFINGMYNDSYYHEAAEKISDWVSDMMKMREYFDLYSNIEELSGSDAFRCIDEIIIGRLIGQMCSTYKPIDSADMQIVRNRKTLHFSTFYKPHYNLIEYGVRLLQEVSGFSVDIGATDSPKTLIDNYASRWYSIDRFYREFIFNADMIDEKSVDIEQYMEFIENTYNNRFLSEISKKLCSMTKTYADLPGLKQTEFYQKHVQRADQATVVIISDAFRYECATELKDRLSRSSRVKDQKLDHMISTLPSITKFGMAALLPNDGLQISGDKYSVKIDGMPTEMDDREAILKAKNPDSVVLKYKQTILMKLSELRDACRGKRVVYIYHNEVDAIGDNAQTEMNTFEACNDAIENIMSLIEKITNRLSYTRFVITSDHGFIYRRKKIDELDKVQLPEREGAAKRYLLSNSACGFMQSVEFSLDYLGEENGEFFVSVPDNCGIYKVPGAGQNFVHGGMSPQEIVVPVLTVHTVKGKVTEEYVGLKAASKPTIRKSGSNISLWQENGVSDKFREATYELWFEDEDGTRVSDIQTVVANRAEGQEMEHHARFTISVNKGSIFLVIKNKTDEDIPNIKEEYNVQIMFTDLGGL
jgi:uncharacterized protein (TIGR02687 family)